MIVSKIRREELRLLFGGRCALCGCELPARGWHADYIGEEYLCGGIAAVCKHCRVAKGNATLEGFRCILAEQVERAQRHSVNFRTALRFGLCYVKADPVVFWFERSPALDNQLSPTSFLPQGISQTA